MPKKSIILYLQRTFFRTHGMTFSGSWTRWTRTLRIYIWKVLGSNLDQDTGYPSEAFLGLSQCLEANFGIVSRLTQRRRSS